MISVAMVNLWLLWFNYSILVLFVVKPMLIFVKAFSQKWILRVWFDHGLLGKLNLLA